MENQELQPRRNIVERYNIPLAIAVAISIIFLAWVAAQGGFQRAPAADISSGFPAEGGALEEVVFPTGGISVAAVWGNVIPQLVNRGVVDRQEFVSLFEQGGTPLGPDELAILDQSQQDRTIVFTVENSRFTVNVLWALGLAQQSDVLDKGPMQTSGTSPENFASTGGWTLGKEGAMAYYSKWNLLNLTGDDQKRVTKITEGIYRPCCGNSTAFPDCNHGMAMLGLVELMVNQGATDDEIFAAAKAANTYWFPDTMFELATYFAEIEKTPWDTVDARAVVGRDYSSAQGAQRVNQALRQAGILPELPQGGGSCGA